MRPLLTARHEKIVTLDDFVLPCPDCGHKLLVLSAYVPRHNRKRVRIESLCLDGCRQFKHLGLELNGVNDKRNRWVPKLVKPQVHQATTLSFVLANLRVLHPKCRFPITVERLEPYGSGKTAKLGVVGNCNWCAKSCHQEVALLYSAQEHAGLTLADFWLICPACRCDVFATRLRINATGSSSAVEIQGSCRCSNTAIRFIHTLEQAQPAASIHVPQVIAV